MRLEAYTWKICLAHLHINMNACVKFQFDLIRNEEVVCSTSSNGYVKNFHKKSKSQGETTHDRFNTYPWKLCHAHLHISMNACVKFQTNLIRNEEVVCSTSSHDYVRILHKKLPSSRGGNSWPTKFMCMKNMSRTSTHQDGCMCEVSWWSVKKCGRSLLHKVCILYNNLAVKCLSYSRGDNSWQP